MKLAICSPYFADTTGLISGSSASPSSPYRLATSNTGIFADASASAKMLTMRERIVSANSSSRKFWSEPATSLRNSFTSTILKSNVPNARARTIPRSSSRIMIGLEVPHLFPVNSRVVT